MGISVGGMRIQGTFTKSPVASGRRSVCGDVVRRFCWFASVVVWDFVKMTLKKGC